VQISRGASVDEEALSDYGNYAPYGDTSEMKIHLMKKTTILSLLEGQNRIKV
jgi:hypothetical protein